MFIRKTILGPVIAAGASLAAAVALAAPAGAYQLQDRGSCDSIKFASGGVRVVVHTTESKATSSELTSLLDAMGDIDATIGLAGGSTAKVTSLTTSTTAFTFGNFYGDTTPTVEVGFSGTLAPGLGGDTTRGPSTNCLYNEAQIVLPDFNSTVNGMNVWNLGTPGAGYYDADITDSSNTLYLRPIYLHELLHAFGLHHSGNSFAMMNYGTRPWFNRPDSLMTQPLPDDVAGLRALYPSSSTRIEVAVVNNYYTANADPRSPATAGKLCQPSLGNGLSTDKFASYCGVNGPDAGSTRVCAGDFLRVRATVANFSTSTAIVTKELYFSTDTTFSDTEPTSVGSYVGDIPAATSMEYGMTFKVPQLSVASGTKMHPILRVISQSDTDGDGVTEADTVRSEWIPLRGTVTAC